LISVTKERMARKVNYMHEVKKSKVEEITRKREEAVKSRHEEIRVKSAVRMVEKERHLQRVKSRSGS